MRIVQVGHDDFRRLAPDARDRLEQLHVVARAATLQLLVNLVLVLTEVLAAGAASRSSSPRHSSSNEHSASGLRC